MNTNGLFRTASCVAAAAATCGAWAGSKPRPRIDCTTDKSPIAYRCGETATFTFSTPDTNGLDLVWTLDGDFGLHAAGTGNVLTATLDRPGFVRVSARTGDGKWPLAYTASAGFDIDKLSPASALPAGFDAFWDQTRAAVAAVPLNATAEEVESPTAGVRLYKVKLDTLGSFASGWLSVPQSADGKQYPAEATFFGYNGSWAKDNRARPTSCPGTHILFRVMAHAFELERGDAYYTEVGQAARSGSYGHGFDPAQNAKPETSYFYGMLCRDLKAIDYLRTRPEWDGRHLKVSGGSQGALQAIWMAALADGVTDLSAEVPWNCNLKGPEAGRCAGDWRVPYAPGLDYFDPVFLARRFPATLRAVIPRAGLGDYVCPPSGVATFYNAIRCPKKIVWVQGGGHGGNPIDRRAYELDSGW